MDISYGIIDVFKDHMYIQLIVKSLIIMIKKYYIMVVKDVKKIYFHLIYNIVLVFVLKIVLYQIIKRLKIVYNMMKMMILDVNYVKKVLLDLMIMVNIFV